MGARITQTFLIRNELIRRLFRDVSFEVWSGKTHDEGGEKLPKFQSILIEGWCYCPCLEEEEKYP